MLLLISKLLRLAKIWPKVSNDVGLKRSASARRDNSEKASDTPDRASGVFKAPAIELMRSIDVS